MRLKDYNYSSEGYYFVTICTKDKINYFGRVNNKEVVLNKVGKIIFKVIKDVTFQFKNVKLDCFIIIPNHVHLMVVIIDCQKLYAINRVPAKEGGIEQRTSKGGITGKYNPMGSKNLSEVVRWIKGKSTYLIKSKLKQSEFKWQIGFYERVISDERQLYNIRRYIKYNIVKWNIVRNK